MLELTVYTDPGCCLCDEAAELLVWLAPALGLRVAWVDISGNPALEAAWREQLPVGVLAGRKVFKHRVNEQLLRRRVAALVAMR